MTGPIERQYTEQLALIDSVPHYGMVDHYARPRLTFSVTFLSGGSTLSLDTDAAEALIIKHYIEDIARLKGAACVIETDGINVRFVRLHS